MEKTSLIEPEVCKRCGADFQCSKSKRCWCYEVNLSSETLEEIERSFDGCLCPKCLNEMEEITQRNRLTH